MSNDRQNYVLYKARMVYEEARKKQNNWCDDQKLVNSSVRKWGEEMDKLNGQLAIEAVEYITVLQEAYDRRGSEIEMLEEKLKNVLTQTKPTESSYPPSGANLHPYMTSGQTDRQAL